MTIILEDGGDPTMTVFEAMISTDPNLPPVEHKFHDKKKFEEFCMKEFEKGSIVEMYIYTTSCKHIGDLIPDKFKKSPIVEIDEYSEFGIEDANGKPA